jgi:ferredoxin-like protein FixX
LRLSNLRSLHYKYYRQSRTALKCDGCTECGRKNLMTPKKTKNNVKFLHRWFLSM